ncbi:peptidase inhibitor family I36 protein (plasmid) [Streptomyces atratus]|uniref:Peptidase inhibitor family I36 n=1 Tax=Streptomyces atratus TaxID=1893 RepID=A0A1K2F1E6_STRAR|nr:peptidase inhibitor family I36 protein [Streptomyces atratus]SFY41703.1 Peptidase inhibitor family I36 [Streptomyces atratus]
MKRTWLAGTVAGMCVTVASVVTGGVPASADVNDCRDGYVCVWGDSNYRGRYLFSATDVHNVGERMNDLTTSLWNRTGSKVCFFDDASWSGAPLLYVAPGQGIPNVGDAANDRITSWHTC